MFNISILMILVSCLMGADFLPFQFNWIQQNLSGLGKTDTLPGFSYEKEKNLYKMVQVVYAAGNDSVPGLMTSCGNVIVVAGMYGRKFAPYNPDTELQDNGDGLTWHVGGAPTIDAKVKEVPFWMAYPLTDKEVKKLTPAQQDFRLRLRLAADTLDAFRYGEDRDLPLVNEITSELDSTVKNHLGDAKIKELETGLTNAKRNLRLHNLAVSSSIVRTAMLLTIWKEYSDQIK